MTATVRELIICDAFADVSDELRTQVEQSEKNPRFVDPMNSAKDKAAAAFRGYKKAYLSNQVSAQASKKEEEFFDQATDFFRLEVHRGWRVVGYWVNMMTRFENEWSKVFEQLNSCHDFLDVGAWYRSYPRFHSALESTLEVRPVSLETLKSKISSRLEILKASEFDEIFSTPRVYERLGKKAALEVFEKQLPTKTGRKPKPNTSINEMRLYQLSPFRRRIDDTLAAHEMPPASQTEVCRATLNVGRYRTRFARSASIKWAYENLFLAKCISLPSFLNSLARGRRTVEREMSRWEAKFPRSQ